MNIQWVKFKKKKSLLPSSLSCSTFLCGSNRRKSHRQERKIQTYSLFPFFLRTNAVHRCWERADPGRQKERESAFKLFCTSSQRQKKITLKLGG
jgi:hypothetical protein